MTPMPRTPISLSDARLQAALAAGRAAALASRLAGKGSGASIRGQVMMKVDPQALGKLLAHRRIAAVTGTNGKTTTTHLLAAAVREGTPEPARRVVTNADGANLYHGVASALGEAAKADIAILETDERIVPRIIEEGRPEVLVLLNFSRDQMDRNHEIKSLGRGWRVALEKAGEAGPVVVANACDPLTTWAAETAKQVIWIDTGAGWTQDAALCPACGAVLAHVDGHWDCPACPLTQPEADYTVHGEEVTEKDGTVWTLDLQVPGRFNRANAACALAAARVMGIEPDVALKGMHSVTSPAGRYAVATFGDVKGRLMLSKNPAGWAESLPLAATDPVVLAIDAVAADGKDVSWLWDVDYEQLAGRHVICTGPRALDLAVRLTYGEVEHEVVPDLSAAMARAGELADEGVVIDVLSTYTPFQKLRKLGGLA
ncbi:UDP-N-acetylmuramyl tripeptide synthase [Luteococcus japonicus]|nr:UDP-N-acetylmuramyl tripeptide synthase [Luteococcus japonicus]